MLIGMAAKGLPQDAKLFDPLEWAGIALASNGLHDAWDNIDDRLKKIGLDQSSYVNSHKIGELDFPEPDSVIGEWVSKDFGDYLRQNQHLCEQSLMAMRLANGDIFEPIIQGHERCHANSIGSEVWEAMNAFGFAGGFTASFHDRSQGTFSAFMTSSLTSGKDVTEAFDNLGIYVRNALVYFNEGLALRDMCSDGKFPQLSPRESECLLWVSAGKSTQQISDLLSLTDRTVNEYIAGAMRKLGATNRAHACARSILLSLISP